MYMSDKKSNEDGSRKKPRKRSSKKSTNNSSTSATPPSNDEDYEAFDGTDPELDNMLRDMLMEHAKKKNLTKNNVKIIHSFIEEYLNSFILLGYTFEGEPVTLVSALNQRDADSLSTFIQKFVMKNIVPPGADF